jgi:DNA/RNA endonuclease YhcR with UshA esterase domain
VSVVKQVSYRSLLSSVATLETTTPHGFSVGNVIVVKGVDSVLDGTHTIQSVPSSTRLTFPKTRIPASSVTGRRLVSNIATLTTSSPHGFLVGENVTITGVDPANYDGTYIISDVSADGLQFSYAKSRTDSKQIVSTFIDNLTASIETSETHGFVEGENVNISGLTQAYNGTYTITSTPSDTTFEFDRVRPSRVSIIAKSATSGVGTLTTSGPNKLLPGDQVTITNVDSTFNGNRVVTSVPSSTAFSFALGTDVTPTQVIGGFATPIRRIINSKSLIGGVATLGTLNTSGVLVGESVTVSGVDAIFNGTYTVTNATDTSFSYVKSSANVTQVSMLKGIFSRSRAGSTVTIVTRTPHGFSNGLPLTVQNLDLPELNGHFTVASTPNSTTFTYSTGVSGAIASAEVPEDRGAYAVTSFVTMSGDVTLNSSADGEASVSGSLPFSTASGLATVSTEIQRTATTGVVVRPEEIRFTPGVQGGSVTVPADILEIDTKDREVAFNGELAGARSKIDVLADFIYLAPGENVLEFEDNGLLESKATTTVYYRSGWLS